MPTIIVQLDPAALDNPDLDIRYVLPDLLVFRAGGLLSDRGDDYAGGLTAEDTEGRGVSNGLAIRSRARIEVKHFEVGSAAVSLSDILRDPSGPPRFAVRREMTARENERTAPGIEVVARVPLVV